MASNLKTVKAFTSAKICAVVKADCYGLGAEAVKALKGADEFAVATVQEAETIKGLVNAPVNVLSLPDKTCEYEYNCGVYPTVGCVEDIKFVRERGATEVNVKVDTGMNRYGAKGEELRSLIKAIDTSGLKIKSAFSHVYDISAAPVQYNRFISLIKPYAGYVPQIHLLSSNFVRLPQYMHLNMVRPGILLYGYGHESVKSAITAVCGITQIKTVKAGENIGYGHNVTPVGRKIAVLGAGYADGIRRVYDNFPRYALVGGELCPMVGQVCMDACFIDVSGLNVNAGDTAELIGCGYGAEAVAASTGTIAYDVLTGFGKRVKRVYKE